MSATDKAIELIGKDKVSCIRKLFENLHGNPPQLGRQRYRADNTNEIDFLDQLEYSHQLIKCDNEHKNYRLSPYSLPLIRNKKSERIISIMSEAFTLMKRVYKERLNALITIDELFEQLDFPLDELQEALFYMFDVHDVWSSKSNDFPYGATSTFSISESVMKRNDFIDVLEDYYRWHLINPQGNLSEESINSLFKRDNPPQNYPAWFQELGETEKSILIEINEGMKTGLRALPLMGLRALLENIMLSHIDDKNSFRKNLDEFHNKGFVTKKAADLLFQVIDAGSAVMHRAHIPTTEDVEICLDVAINLIQSLKLRPKIDELHQKLPKRK